MGVAQMTRRACNISHDEVARLLKAAKSAGVSIRSFSFDGSRVEFVVNDGDSGDIAPLPSSQPETHSLLLTEPKL